MSLRLIFSDLRKAMFEKRIFEIGLSSLVVVTCIFSVRLDA